MREEIVRLQALLSQENVDAILLQDKVQKAYFGTMTGSGCTVFITKTEAFLIVDGRYFLQAKKNEQDLEIILWDEEKEHMDRYAWIEKYCRRNRIQTMAIEDSIAVNRYIQLQKFVNVVFFQEQLLRLRCIKRKNEIKKIRKACQITDEVFDAVIRTIRCGMTDFEISGRLYYEAMRRGAEKASFDPIIGLGQTSAFPHHRPDGSIVKKNEIILIDFGFQFEGFQSDMTRVCAIGTPSDKILELYEIVYRANRAGLSAMRAGNLCKNVDKAARDVIVQAGYGKFFTHGLGHGIGRDNSTELPKVNSSSEMRLEEGMTMSCEPGIYLEDVGGIRIEDVVLIENGVGIALSRTAREIHRIKE